VRGEMHIGLLLGKPKGKNVFGRPTFKTGDQIKLDVQEREWELN
jgi:hypothetical protein